MHTKNNPPTPAAVRCALAHPKFEGVTMEEAQALKSDPRTGGEALRDHIRAIAQEMRSVIPHGSKVTLSEAIHASVLNSFADRLEGKQNENT